MIILVGNEKGGVGKSTIAINIAVYRAIVEKEDILILDTDKQGTSANFVSQRRSNKLSMINCLQKHGDIFEDLQDLKTRYSSVIVDAGGQDSPELRSAMMVADVLVMPLRASQIDLWSAERMNKLIGTAKNFNRNLKVKCVISMAPTNPNITERDEAVEMLKEYSNLIVADAVIMDRKIYRDSIVEGKGVVEMQNDKATKEIQKLVTELYNE